MCTLSVTVVGLGTTAARTLAGQAVGLSARHHHDRRLANPGRAAARWPHRPGHGRGRHLPDHRGGRHCLGRTPPHQPRHQADATGKIAELKET